MAKKRKAATCDPEETRRRAHAIAETVSWLVQGEGNIDPSVAEAIDRAYAALCIAGEVAARNQVCVYLASSRLDDPRHLREALALIGIDPIFGVAVDTSKLRDETIMKAFAAWKRSSADRGGLDKWHATLALLKECGLVTNVTAAALRKAWDRRLR